MNHRQNMNRKWLAIGFLALAAGCNEAQAGVENTAADAPIISIKASRFVFQPNRIRLKKGQTVVLEIETTDGMHGFSVPDLGIRADATPGKKTVIRFTPTRSGSFVFFCDIFCGSGHEEMTGEILVEN
jgi:cytochrome c oxidase subunit II